MKRCCQSYCRRVGTTPSKGCVIVVLVDPLETCDDHDLTVIKLPADPLGIDLFKSCIAVIACRVHGYLECIQGAGWWEVPGGGVNAGEDSRDAVIREIREETGIDVSQAAGGYAFSYKRVNPEEKNNYFVDIYKFILDFVDNDVKVQPEEVEGFKIATLEEIRAFAQEGIFLHYDSMKEVFD